MQAWINDAVRRPGVPDMTEGAIVNWRNTEERYGSLAIALHWLMFALLIAVVALMELRGLFPKGSMPRESMKSLHYTLGLLVFLLAAMRLLVRRSGPVPLIAPRPPGWERGLAALVKIGLYVIMLGMPLVGWSLLSASADPIAFFGMQLPPLVAPNEALAETLEEIHEAGASAAYVLVALHAAAGLYHHYIVRDNTLKRMLPRL